MLNIYRQLSNGEKALVWIAAAALVVLVIGGLIEPGGTEAATISGALIAAAATLFGAWLSRWLRQTGEVRCEAAAVDSLPIGIVGPGEGKPSLPVSEDELDQPIHGISYSLDVELFNEKEVSTGLKNLVVAFLDEAGRTLISCPIYDRLDAAVDGGASRNEVDRVLLRPGEFVVLHLDTMLEIRPAQLEEDKEMIKRTRRAEFRGEFPDGKGFRHRIEFPASFEAS